MTREELRKAKQRTGYTTAQISEKTEIPVGTLNKLFSGVTKNPRRDTIAALERFFVQNDGWMGRKGDCCYENGEMGMLYVHEGSSPVEINRKSQGTYTVQDYKDIPAGTRVELIGGCLYTMESPTFTHQIMVQEVYEQIQRHIKKKKGSCFVSNMAMDVFLMEGENTVVVPDLFLLCDKKKMQEDGVHGAPDFILEVLSKSTRGKDLYIKPLKYNSAGVRELWIIDPAEKVLYGYYFEGQIPMDIRPLSGKKEMKIFGGDLLIDLDNIVKAAERFYTDL